MGAIEHPGQLGGRRQKGPKAREAGGFPKAKKEDEGKRLLHLEAGKLSLQ